MLHDGAGLLRGFIVAQMSALQVLNKWTEWQNKPDGRLKGAMSRLTGNIYISLSLSHLLDGEIHITGTVLPGVQD